MAFCGKCGQKIEEGIKFCPACGAPVEVNATQSAQSQQPAGGYNQADIEQNKVMAVLAYFGILVLIPIFAAKESKFARFHSNQGLVLCIAAVLYGVAYSILSAVVLAISWRLYFVVSLLGLVSIVFAVLAVIGISWISISLENGLTAAGVIAVTALSFNLLLINEVAVPFSSLRSDKEIGLELAQSYRVVDEIGVYGKYSTSAVFYSGKKIIKLVPDEDLANFAPKAYSWKVKNVMPFEGINSFGRRGQLLLVKKNEAGKFLNGSNGKWLVTGEKGGWYILKSA